MLKTHECAVLVGYMYECCVFVESSKLDLPESRRPVGQVRGARIWAGVLGRKRVCAGTRGSMNVCVLVDLESSVLAGPTNRKVTSYVPQPGQRLQVPEHCAEL